MKKLLIIVLLGLLTGCKFFESDRYFVCTSSLPDDGEKFSIVVTGSTVKVKGVTHDRCDSKDTSLTISDNCKDLEVGYMGILDLVTGQFYSTIKDTKDSKVRDYTKGECKKVEKM